MLEQPAADAGYFLAPVSWGVFLVTQFHVFLTRRLGFGLVGLLVAAVAGLALPAFADGPQAFVVEDIRIDGLQRVSAGTVFAALPVQVGDQVDAGRVQEIIRGLFASGYFREITVGRDGDVLVVRVRERPTITRIEIDGNKAIKTEQLMEAMQGVGLAEGQVFKRATLERMQLELKRQYVSQGRYGIRIDTNIEEQPRNRVAIDIQVEEGSVAKIRHINIVGNQVFTDEELLGVFELSEASWRTVFSSSDDYARERLAGDLERLRSHYLDRGYIRFNVDSTQVAVSPERDSVFITINVTEGPQYNVGEVDLLGDLKVPETALEALIQTTSGATFSRRLMTSSSDLMRRYLGEFGYTFANVNGVPEVDDSARTVDITYYVEPGDRVYVNRIQFRGNVKTDDEVLRREMQQMESALASAGKIELSKARLERLGIFSQVDLRTDPVPGRSDQIDLEYSVEEQASGAITASVGFGQSTGLILGGSIQQNNFLGTGNNVSLSLNSSRYQDSYSFRFFDPYFTVDGVSRGYRIFYQQTDFDEFDVAEYATDAYGIGITFGYPIADTQRLSFEVNYENTGVEEGLFPDLEVSGFLARFGDTFDAFELGVTWRESTLAGGVLANRGHANSVGLEFSVPGSTLEYYILRLKSEYIQPITGFWKLRTIAEVAYGDSYGATGGYPFFRHFYAGGLGSVRGYDDNSLGRKGTPDPDPSNFDQRPDPFGGNLLTEASVEWVFPFPGVENHSALRTAFFVDAGNVFDTNRGFDFDADELRYSAGFGVTWITAIAPLSFSFARALNDEPGDDTSFFQFSIGFVR